MPDQNDQTRPSGGKDNQADQQQGQSDDPRQAKESGDPLAEGRLRGRPIDEQPEPGKTGGDSKDWESGRRQA